MFTVTDIQGFYPTPVPLIEKMWNKIPKKDRQDINYILEPSAGKGDIIKYIIDKDRYRTYKIHAVEQDQNLISILRGKDINVVDQDFLKFNGSDKYDLIIGNPPFLNGASHLLKAIDILYSGHIVFLLNAQTLKNPNTNTRNILVRKLKELNADIEYIENTFIDAERKTKVEVALIHIKIEREIEQDLFAGIENGKESDNNETAHEQKELMKKDSIRGLVAEYDRTINIGTQTLLDFYKNYHHVSAFINVESTNSDDNGNNTGTLTEKMKKSLNDLIKNARKYYWKKALELDRVKSRMTHAQVMEFNSHLQKNEFMNFTANNIRTFILNLIDNYEDTLSVAVAEIFDKMTISHAWHEELNSKNVHYFDGWKTNKAFYVNTKVILPYYDESFWSKWYEKWDLEYSIKGKLNDIDTVMNYFDGLSEYTSIVDALTKAFAEGESKNIKSTYFTITTFKKGTLHLTFNDPDILRRFNVTACKHKNWIPQDYGQNAYKTLSIEDKKIVDSFEGKQSYNKNLIPGNSMFRINEKDLIQIDYK